MNGAVSKFAVKGDVMSKESIIWAKPNGLEFGHSARPNGLYLKKRNGELITKDYSCDSIQRTYYRWQGRYGNDLDLRIPKVGKKGDFNAHVYIENNDSSWSRTLLFLKGKMNEVGDVIELTKWADDGHGHRLNYSLLDDICAHTDAYPKSFIRLAKKCLAYIEKSKF